MVRILILTSLLFALNSCVSKSSRENKESNTHTLNDSTYVRSEVENQIEQPKESVAGDSFLNGKEGEWICYKYQTDNTAVKFDKSYAEEFSKYAYFTIQNDTLSAMGVYNSPIYSYKHPVKFKKYNIESVFITSFQPDGDYTFFVTSYNSYEYYTEENHDVSPYYRDAPMNNTLWFWNDNFLINDGGYFFFFKKGTRKKDGIYGVPGDERNYFEVKKTYNTSIEELLNLLKIDFPFGFEQVMTEANKELFFANDWKENKTLKLEKSQANGKFVMEIVLEDSNIKLLYRMASDFEDAGDEFDG